MSLSLPRSSGILLHPTSLPGPYGTGEFGDEARAFIDFLVDAGQSLWQVLPLSPTGFGDSPYQSLSAFAGNTLLIGARELAADGFLHLSDLETSFLNAGRYDRARALEIKSALLRVAFARFHNDAANSRRSEFEDFCGSSASWLDNFALFCALKDAHQGQDWTHWPGALAHRETAALSQARAELAEEINFYKFCQFLFFRQWVSLKQYCHERGIRLIGDIPIFVAHDSVDVWSHQEYFQLDADGQPLVVAGVPPDYFSETGQLWGNPLYDWDRLEADGFGWWIERVRFAFDLFDLVRIDHFRGFESFWEIPAGDQTAERGRWVLAPGRELFRTLGDRLGDLPIIAENLGVITPAVENLREEFGFPGMRVLQFAFDGDRTNVHLPHNYTTDVVVYTGTHDNDTTVGWFKNLNSAEEKQREFCLEYLKSDGREINWDMIRAAMESVAEIAIIPLQDVLGLGSEARMNLPATEAGNWQWRFSGDALTPADANRLREITHASRRLSGRLDSRKTNQQGCKP